MNMYEEACEHLSKFGEVISPGLVDTKEKAFEAGKFFKEKEIALEKRHEEPAPTIRDNDSSVEIATWHFCSGSIFGATSRLKHLYLN